MKRWLPLAALALLGTATAADAQFTPRPKSNSPLARPSAEEMRKPVFPESAGRNLAGEEVAFPQALTGHLSLVFLTSKPDEEYFFETWMPSLARLAERFEGFRFYIVPLGTPPDGWPLTPSARSRLSAEEHRQAVVPLALERRALLEKLGLPTDETLRVVLVGDGGEVLWHAAGGRTNGKAHDLEKQASIASNDGGG